MTINLPALPGDKVHVVNDGSRVSATDTSPVSLSCM